MKLSRKSIFFLCVLIWNLWNVSSELIVGDPFTHSFVDEDGRQRLFHGVNVVYKSFPYYPVLDHFDPALSFCEEDMQLLQEWGLNVVRLGLMWPGAQPSTRETFNNTYLDIMKGVVSKMNDYGIYALLDCHQDIMTEKFCGEGVPHWASIPSLIAQGFPAPLDSPYPLDPTTGAPSWQDCAKHSWADYYFTEAISSSFQNIYDNEYGLQDAFGNFWRKVAEEFKDYPNLLGYELINEPWAGDIYRHPTLMIPGQADLHNLQPMYDNLHKAIRKVDDEHLIFFEPVTWDDFGVGFTSVPGGVDYQNRSVLSYHYYQPPDLSIEEAMKVRMEDLKKLQCAGCLTEYDMRLGFAEETLTAADLHLQSWMGWEYKAFVPITGWSYGLWNENGTLNVDNVKLVSRTYPTAVAGFLTFMFFDEKSAIFELRYTINSKCYLPTEIYLNEDLHYPHGYTVRITPASAATWQRTSKNRITVSHVAFNGDIAIDIQPKIRPM